MRQNRNKSIIDNTLNIVKYCIKHILNCIKNASHECSVSSVDKVETTDICLIPGNMISTAGRSSSFGCHSYK